MPNALNDVPGLGPYPDRKPRNSLMDMLEQFSIGSGHGLQNNLVGFGQMLANPLETLGGLYQAAQQPEQVANAMMSYGKQAIQSPMGAGQFMGEMFDPSLFRSVARMAPKALKSDMTAYHGSPHDFDAFDSSKIGTGEGAQAYGHGLYFAENKGVAKGYQIQNAYKAFDVASEAEKRGIKLNAGGRGEFIRQAGTDVDDMTAAKRLQYANTAARDIPQEQLASLIGDYRKSGRGKLYNVDIPDDAINKMLDWDSPLSEQPQHIKDLLGGRFNDWTTGEEMYHQIATKRTGQPQAGGQEFASNELKALGIPGIRYLDAGSRSSAKGDAFSKQFASRKEALTAAKQALDSVRGKREAGHWQDIVNELENPQTRNFVVFDDKILKILSKE